MLSPAEPAPVLAPEPVCGDASEDAARRGRGAAAAGCEDEDEDDDGLLAEDDDDVTIRGLGADRRGQSHDAWTVLHQSQKPTPPTRHRRLDFCLRVPRLRWLRSRRLFLTVPVGPNACGFLRS